MTRVRFLGFLSVMLISSLRRPRFIGWTMNGRNRSSNNGCYAFASHAQNLHHGRHGGFFGAIQAQSTHQFATHFSIPRGGEDLSSSDTSFSASAVRSVAHNASTQISQEKLLSDRAEESVSIAGTSTGGSLKSFGGLTYRDSLSEKEGFRVIFVLGGPGAGKGTQCELLKQNYPCVHLSAGQLLREEAAKKDSSEHAALIEECLVAGKIVPVEISLELLRNAMKDADGQALLFLIDGFPRNFDNLEGWTRVMPNGSDPAAVWGVLSYDCPLAVLEKRVMERSKESGRSDDNIESLRRRFETFQSETVPVVDTLRLIDEKTLMTLVDIAGDKSLEQVWEDTQKTMNNFIANDVLSANVRLIEAAARKDVDLYRSFCADEMFDNVHKNDYESSSPLSPKEIMTIQEGTNDVQFSLSNIKCAEMTFVTGKKVSLTYERKVELDVWIRETRIWSHQGAKGWRMVHFYRTPAA